MLEVQELGQKSSEGEKKGAEFIVGVLKEEDYWRWAGGEEEQEEEEEREARLAPGC